jgi:hypothetical protein
MAIEFIRELSEGNMHSKQCLVRDTVTDQHYLINTYQFRNRTGSFHSFAIPCDSNGLSVVLTNGITVISGFYSRCQVIHKLEERLNR